MRGHWDVYYTGPQSLIILVGEGGLFFLGAISIGRVMVSSLKIDTNLPRTYDKLYILKINISVHHLPRSFGTNRHTDTQTHTYPVTFTFI